MQNYIVIKKKTFKAQCLWRNNKTDYTRDDDDKLFPYPVEQPPWSMSKNFIKRLSNIEMLIETKKPMNEIYYKEKKNCLLCGKKNITSKRFVLGDYLWEDGLKHYIKAHNIKPENNFIDFIFDLNPKKYFAISLVGRIVDDNNIQYLKLEKNQIMILDALMKHGGYSKKYYDFNNKNLTRYSEHAGFFEIKNKLVYDIIVSGHTLRVDKGDEEIYLPGNMPEALKFQYLFHTHPPTPKPGGRAADGIIYEFPSIGDILHFMDHFNMGETIGSIVIAPEGLYNIRKLTHDKKKIKINEDNLYNDVRKEISSANEKSINDYGIDFNTYTFYSKIAQNTKYIEMINKKLEKYFIHIDYFPREKDFRGSWIIDTIYLPLH
jgi:hypothetical protein